MLGWGLVPAFLASLAGAFLARSGESHLALARERLLAGRPQEAARALGRVHWPPLAARTRAGAALAAALAGGSDRPAAAAGIPPPALQTFDPEGVLVAALDRGDADAAARVAALLQRSGDGLGALYAAAFAFDRGDERPPADTPGGAPLASRGEGQRLALALEALARGARTLLWDRSGRLVGTIDGGGTPHLTAEGAGVLDQALGRLADGADTLPRGASAVRLALDAELSRVALDALAGHRGSIVLLEPHTGSLLAAVSDPSTPAAEPSAAFAERREPASIAKLVTTAAAYRAGLDADAAIRRMTCGGVERYGGKPLWCAFPAGPLEGGLDQALGLSCNIAFANLGVLVGRERLIDEYHRWGFDDGARALLGAAGRVHGAVRGPREVADLAIGLEQVDVTPVHAATLAGVVADGGKLAATRLVDGATSALALRDRSATSAPPREVVPAPVAARLRAAMRAVALRGTGAGLAPDGFAVAMKTGTASTPGLGYHVNYIGMAPLPVPAIAFAVRVTGERSSPAVTQAAREVTKRLLEALARRTPRLVADARRARLRARR